MMIESVTERRRRERKTFQTKSMVSALIQAKLTVENLPNVEPGNQAQELQQLSQLLDSLLLDTVSQVSPDNSQEPYCLPDFIGLYHRAIINSLNTETSLRPSVTLKREQQHYWIDMSLKNIIPMLDKVFQLLAIDPANTPTVHTEFNNEGGTLHLITTFHFLKPVPRLLPLSQPQKSSAALSNHTVVARAIIQFCQEHHCQLSAPSWEQLRFTFSFKKNINNIYQLLKNSSNDDILLISDQPHELQGLDYTQISFVDALVDQEVIHHRCLIFDLREADASQRKIADLVISKLAAHFMIIGSARGIALKHEALAIADDIPQLAEVELLMQKRRES